MKVAQVICAGSFGGAEAVACSLAKALVGKVDRSILYLVVETRASSDSCDALVRRVRGYGIEVRQFQVERRFSKSFLHELGGAIHADAIDVVHNHSYKTAFYSGLLRRRQRRFKSVFTIHGFDQSHWRGATFLHVVNLLGAYLADRVIGVSRPLEAYYRRFPFLSKKTTFIPNAFVGDSPHSMAEVRAEREAARRVLSERFGLDEQSVWVASIGRLVEVKNHEMFLDCAARLGPELPVKFLIVGSGPREQALKTLAGQNGADRFVTFTGNAENVRQVYSAIDALSLTSHSEACPMVVLESMAFGVPIAAASVGGVPDLITDGEDGFLFQAGDLAGCTDQLRRLISDAELRDRLAATAMRKSQTKFHADHWTDRHLNIYRCNAGN